MLSQEEFDEVKAIDQKIANVRGSAKLAHDKLHAYIPSSTGNLRFRLDAVVDEWLNEELRKLEKERKRYIRVEVPA